MIRWHVFLTPHSGCDQWSSKGILVIGKPQQKQGAGAYTEGDRDMLPCDTPADKDSNDPPTLLMGLVPIFEEFDAEVQKLRAEIINNERRIVALEAALHGLLW